MLQPEAMNLRKTDVHLAAIDLSAMRPDVVSCLKVSSRSFKHLEPFRGMCILAQLMSFDFVFCLKAFATS